MNKLDRFINGASAEDLREIIRSSHRLGETARSSSAKGGVGRLPLYGGSVGDEAASVGDAFVESDAYKAWLERFPSGGPSTPGEYRSDPVSLRTSTQASLGLRAPITSDDASGGALVRPEYVGLLEPGLVRPLRLRDLITLVPVASDQVDYSKETSRASTAAPVEEATATAGTSGTKPEGGLTFTSVTVNVRTFALWVPATTRVVTDSPQLRAYINQYLEHDIGLEVEDQIVAGPGGAGEDFTGIMNTVGVQTIAAPTAPATNLDSIRKAMTLVRLNARTEATAVALHPTDAQNIALLKVNDEANRFVTDPYGLTQQSSLWGLPIVETDAIPAGTALVGDFRKAILFDRHEVQIALGTIGDQFVRNMVTVLGELRAGFGVTRPAAFVKATLA